jgi:hypothetical protein
MRGNLATNENVPPAKRGKNPIAEPQTVRQYWVCELIQDPFRIGQHVYQTAVWKFIVIAYCSDKKSASELSHHTGRVMAMVDVFDYTPDERFAHKKNYEFLAFVFPVLTKRLP